MQRKKIEPQEKIYAVLRYLDGGESQMVVAKDVGVSLASFQQWVRNYQSMGAEIFFSTTNKKYSKELKIQAVQDYLDGVGSQDDICKKYKIRSKSKLQSWIMRYNSPNGLKSSPDGGFTVKKGRITTYDERIEIVEFCIEHNRNYAMTAEKYQVSYQQVYTWLRKYEIRGVEGLIDHRGKNKPQSEMTEIEKLRAENKLLKAKNKSQEAEVLFLKKSEEIERGRF